MSSRRRTVVVSGSASGIGEAVCRRFEQTGSRVIGIDRRDADIIVDLATADGRTSAVKSAHEMADGRIDTLVACAGLGPHVRPASDIVRVNYFGVVSLLDGLLPALEDGEAPAAVAIASNSASLTPRHDGLLAKLSGDDEEEAATLAASLGGITSYGMSKLALVRAVRSRARKWGSSGVRLNAVAPGPIDTPMMEGILSDAELRPAVEALPIPLERRGTPEEVARAIAFLVDPSNRYIHGSILFVDGGSDAELRPDAI